MAGERTVHARWDGDLRAIVQAGDHEIVVDEPRSVAGGTDRGPQPTELLLASVASCFTISIAYSARKRHLPLAGLDVRVTGAYDGPQFRAIRIVVHAAQPGGDDLARLVESAKRVCYVTRTLTLGPEISVQIDGAGGDLP
ncbi:MAG: OsmC family protein [Pseudonocardia sp.]